MKPILLVDDDDFFLEILTRNIKQVGFEVMKATCISEAKEVLQSTEPLLICSDLKISDGSGFELLDYVQENMPEIPFIVMSIYEREDFSDEAAQKGAIYSISKSEYSKLPEIIMEFANQSLPAEERPFHYRLLYLCTDFQRATLLRKELLKLKCHVIFEKHSADIIGKLLNKMRVELIICDSNLPKGETLKFLKSLKQDMFLRLCKETPPCMIFMQEDDPVSEETYFQAGAYECIPAPANISEVSFVLQNYFELT